MSVTEVDYSKYPYKISEKKWVDWDGLFFTLDFIQPVNEDQKKEIEKVYNGWGVKNQEGDISIHFFSDPTWSKDLKSLQFWVDMGSTELPVLKDLLSLFSKYKNIIQELFIGRDPKPKEQSVS
ncbi:MAG: hypothetical protein MUP45_03595 [Candidatus Marinimicrobia bacterium]|nr:hypothetical protein [Candidatus Neomarinimicrobiota bacterium]